MVVLFSKQPLKKSGNRRIMYDLDFIKLKIQLQWNIYRCTDVAIEGHIHLVAHRVLTAGKSYMSHTSHFLSNIYMRHFGGMQSCCWMKEKGRQIWVQPHLLQRVWLRFLLFLFHLIVMTVSIRRQIIEGWVGLLYFL